MNFRFLPNLITLFNLFLGCIVILLLVENNLEVKYVFIISSICLVLDYLDGFIARKLNAKSEIGLQLDSLADLLIHDYPNVVVELRSHTDFRGSQELNIPLSQNRAQSCVDYLVEKGVSVERLVAIGMSDKEPKQLDVAENGLTSGLLNKDYINQLQSNRESLTSCEKEKNVG